MTKVKDPPEIVEFLVLFARLKDWSDDDPLGLLEIASADEGVRDLGLRILRAAGTIQKSEGAGRDLFTGPVDPKFISEWRDFEERFASVLLSMRSDVADHTLFSLDYYEEPDQWEMADFKAIVAARSPAATIGFAQTQAENALGDGHSVTFHPINLMGSPEMRDAYKQMATLLDRADININNYGWKSSET